MQQGVFYHFVHVIERDTSNLCYNFWRIIFTDSGNEVFPVPRIGLQRHSNLLVTAPPSTAIVCLAVLDTVQQQYRAFNIQIQAFFSPVASIICRY